VRLVLLPGLEGTGRLFQPLLAHLDSAFEPLVVSYSSAAKTYEEIVPAVRRELPRDRPFVLLAESFSGPVAILLASERPAGLRALVLSASFARSPLPGGSALRLLVGPKTFRRIPRALILRALLGRHARSHVAVDVREAIFSVPTSTIVARIGEALRVDVSAKLQRLDLPILYLAARHDRIVPPAAAEHVARCAPQTTIVTIAGPHLLLQTAPAEAASAIGAFAAEASVR
jgi:pimeloyl-ACP methyl ester carboxylesterase